MKLKNIDSYLCPYCGCEPYEYVDVGVAMVPVAVTCCSAGIEFFQYNKTPHEIHKMQRELKRIEKRHGNFMTRKDVIALG